jgi:hypothetical protein
VFWEPPPQGLVGFCHESPPTVMLIGMTEHPLTHQQMPMANSFWPQTQGIHWCGRHESSAPLGEMDFSALQLQAPEGSA